jgi:N6-adenosine-specific RNA methylase IME4
MSKKYSIIYADPPWSYPKTGGKTSSRGMAKQFYDTMSLEDIKLLPIGEISATNAILFIWVTYPQMQNGLDVIRAWGFEYFGLGFNWIKKTSTNKDFFGMGYWTRANPEMCLIAIKGKMKPKSHSIRQLLYSPIQEHSQKPPEVRDMIVEIAGDLPRVELFARQKTEGWDIWGNELENDVEMINIDGGE